MRATAPEIEINDTCADEAGVPVGLIASARATFGAENLTFEILMSTREAALGLTLCADIANLGLRVTHVTYRATGSLFVIVEDNAEVAPEMLPRAFASDGVCVLRWTNSATFANRQGTRPDGRI